MGKKQQGWRGNPIRLLMRVPVPRVFVLTYVVGVGVPVSVLTFDTSNAHRSGSSPTWRSSIQQVGGGLGKLFAETRLKPGIFNARTKERVG
jgi:hypothetical protein